LRDERAVFFSPSINAFVVTRYADCLEVLNHPEVFSSNPPDSLGMMATYAAAYLPIYEAAGVPPCIPTLVTTDGTVHRRYRSAVDRNFSAASVRALEPSIRELVDRLIDDFADAGRTDIYDSFCKRLPLFVICDMLGLPRDIAPMLRRSADAMARLAGGALETEESRIQLHRDQAEFHRWLLPLIHRLRAEPDETLLSRLIHTPTDDGTLLSDAELLSLVTTLNVGGNETTTNGLGNMFWICFGDPALQRRLRADRSRVEAFVEEALRVESPVAAMPRWVMADTKIGDTPIPAGSAVQVSFSAANRDGKRFGCPADLDLHRSGARNHIAFGMGPHYCLGAMLSRSELKIAMNRILDRLDNIRLDAAADGIRHQHKVIVRGLTALPIVFDRVPEAALSA
jgi:cytochrome P450